MANSADVRASDFLIFTPRVLEAARKARHASSLLLRWAAIPRERGGDALRAQIERAACLVPLAQRSRVLGPLRFPAKDDDQARTTVGNLLLAKTLLDLGWQVDFEPDVDGDTPDLRITKADETYFVELHRIRRLPSGFDEQAMARIRDAVSNMKTHTPIMIRAASVPGSASLKPFASWLRNLLASAEAKGKQVFRSNGVFVVVEVLGRRFPEPMPAIFGWSGRLQSGSYHATIRESLDEKLKRYKYPLIVALDFFDPFSAFDQVLDVLIGQPVMRISVALEDGAVAPPPEPGRADDGLVLHRGAQGERARERLQGVLPFYLRHTDDGEFAVCARVMTNPILPSPSQHLSFAPIPRWVVVEESEAERSMRYLDSEGRQVDGEPSWYWVP